MVGGGEGKKEKGITSTMARIMMLATHSLSVLINLASLPSLCYFICFSIWPTSHLNLACLWKMQMSNPHPFLTCYLPHCYHLQLRVWSNCYVASAWKRGQCLSCWIAHSKSINMQIQIQGLPTTTYLQPITIKKLVSNPSKLMRNRKAYSSWICQISGH